MNVFDIYYKLYSTIGNYCVNIIDRTNDCNIEKYFDVENQKNVDIVINPSYKLLTNSCEYVDNNKCDNTIDGLIPECLILGGGFDRTIGLEWKRTSVNEDYKVSYKGLHLIPFEQIEKIYCKIEHNKSINFENILKLYIDCGKNLDLTITYLEL